MRTLRLILGAILVFFVGGSAIASGFLKFGLKECLWGVAVAIVLIILTSIAYQFGYKDAGNNNDEE